jgi:hypothetical protein
MQRRSLKTAPFLLLATGCGLALAAASACSNSPNSSTGASGSGNSAAGTPATGGGGAGATVGGNGTGGIVATAGNATGGAGTAGNTVGGAPVGGTGGGGGGGAPPACKAGAALNGSGLTLKATDISAFTYAQANGFMKMAYDPMGKVVVLLKQNGQMSSFDPNVALPATASNAPVTTVKAYDSGYTANGAYTDHRGIVFGPDGSLYVLAASGGDNVGVNIKKGTPGAGGGARTWTNLVTTSMGFPAGHTDYDHTFSGIAISKDGMNLYFSSGSRCEHGEVENGLREVPLSSAIFKVSTTTPTDLKNTDDGVKPYMFSDGTRNTFDLAFNADGDLFGTENGPDIDLPDEVNFLEAGKHYGFPWRFGATDNPVLDPAYTPTGDKRLNGGYGAVKNGLYKYDAGFMPKPAGVTFTDPIVNMGPDAIMARADRNADAVATPGLAGITGHRSPLGLSFDTEGVSCGDYYKAGFMLSYGALVGAALGDGGEDLLLLQLTKAGGTYSMKAKQIATGIKTPMDSVLVGNRLFTAGYGAGAQVFVFVLPTP